MTKRPLAPRRTRAPRPRTRIQAVVDETIALYQWLAWVAERLYEDGARGTTRRWVLRRLARDGASTLGALAQVRSVRRQSLQPIVDALVGEGLVRRAPNPRHARAPLYVLAAAGERLVASFDRVDGAVLRAVARGLDDEALSVTAETLRALRAAFETKMKWAPAAAAAQDGSTDRV